MTNITDHGGPRGAGFLHPVPIVGRGLIAGLLLTPAVAMRLTPGAAWTALGFLVAGALFVWARGAVAIF